MQELNVKVIYIKTSTYAKKSQLDKIQSSLDKDILSEIIGDKDTDAYILIPDVMKSHSEEMIKLAKIHRDKDLVIVLGNPSSPLMRLLTKFASNPLGEIIGSKLGLVLIIYRKLLDKTDSIGSLHDLLDSATRIVKIVYDVPLYDYILTAYSRLPRPLLLALLEPVRTIKFALVGLSGVFINILTVQNVHTSLMMITDPKLRALLASMTGFETSLTWNFMLHELWTFKDLSLQRNLIGRITRWLKYHVASIGSLLAQTSTVTLLSGLLGVPLHFSVILGVGLGFMVNYLIGRTYTWKSSEE